MGKLKPRRENDEGFVIPDTKVETPNLMDLYDEIDQLTDGEPRDKRSKEYSQWKKTINGLMLEYNKLSGRKAFSVVK